MSNVTLYLLLPDLTRANLLEFGVLESNVLAPTPCYLVSKTDKEAD
jgi:hypothetical protein